ncbi:MAG TPA: hypothetical protein VMW16_09730 [Sedimentisphaerales bacterium]|nr:hypothetical protein [Sedimentisphaerales bacterium]
MDVTKQEAEATLEQIQALANHTRRAIASKYTSPLLILWGLVFTVAYLGTHFFVARAFHIWMVLDAIGLIGTFFICWQQLRSASPIKVSPAEKMGWRMFWFWTLLFVYIFIWLNIMAPVKAVQMNAFMVTAVMFASVAKGLWLRSSFMVWFGLAVTAITLFGLYLVPRTYYCLWMAVMAGGAFLASGLYLRLRWR